MRTISLRSAQANKILIEGVVKESEEGKPWAASFSFPLDSYSLKLFSTISIFDNNAFADAQEIGATNGLDSTFQAQKLAEMLFVR